MRTGSYWLNSVALPRFPALSQKLSTDVVVVGGGITGITAAYLLKKSGRRVVLLERGRCAGVDTGHTTAHLTCVTDLRLGKMVNNFGLNGARTVWEAGCAALDQIAANIQAESIACDFKWIPGYLHAVSATAGKDIRALKRETKLALELGFLAEFVPAVPYFETPGIRFSHQAKFHPIKYLAKLLQAIPGSGSHVFEHTEATDFGNNSVSVKSGDYKISCDYVVIATHTPLMGKAGIVSSTLLQTKLSLYSSYVLGMRLPSRLIPDALFWDTADPYNYLRVECRRGFDYGIFGGGDHKTGQMENTEAVYQGLEKVVRRRIPGAEVKDRWSGQVIETNDGLPLIGETAERQFAATGFAGNGMTFGTLGAMMALDAVERRKNPWAELFAPDRKTFKGGTWEYLKENKDYPYYLLRDRIAHREGRNLNAVKRGQGKILNLKGRKVAAYRDDTGRVSVCSPVCTHLKCIVHWNESEKTWDCPCHGSRFKPTGEVIAGPAEEPLERLREE